ncbi:Na+-driven multidrug efflux pump [Agrobacterium vitis]|uniref:Na+-driven multidrug efflux pump n=1 Tax=Agrobacterium vitis TaxID=373 RepID=A0AAE5AWK2_AGRVI|nr:MATE family efflux transporter [Agrobacterium vitis]MCM2442234.1 Na+-driven multidrug efflux pump [Agrobacterium vitis]MUZ58644.1 Na+-driven multidrug efflux pump [Agrobacterium vitis]MVA66279.1 Na+-driven multidrug efflux pump [Agrobacterium vitis]MVA88316.1 Na+-driven multidrug efflux pump [Agrobacterium vitis]
MTPSKLFGNRAFLYALFATAIPSALQHFAFSAQQVVDTVMVAHLGDASIAALSFCGAAFFVITSILYGLVMAAGALISQHWGAGDRLSVRKTLYLSTLMTQIVSVPAVVLFVIFPDWVMRMGPQSEEVRSAGVSYLQIAGWSLLMWPVIVGVGNALNMTGRAALSMALSLAFVTIAVLCNYIFVFGMGPVPATGVKGAALGTLVVNIMFFFIYIALLKFHLAYLLLRRDELRLLLDLKKARQFVAQSLPLALNGGLWSGGLFGYQVVFSQVGELGLAAFGLLLPIITVYLTLFNGLATGSGAMIGQALGRRDYPLAWQYAVYSVNVAAAFGILTSIGLFLLRDQVNILYPSISPELSQEFLILFSVSMLLLWIRGINIVVINGILRIGADNGYILKIDTISSWGVGIPLSILAAVVLGLPMVFVYFASFTEEITKCMFSIYRMHRKIWCRTIFGDTP